MAITTDVEFSRLITSISMNDKCSTMEALIKYCDEHFIEPEEIKSLITPAMRDRLRDEFVELNMLKRTAKFDV